MCFLTPCPEASLRDFAPCWSWPAGSPGWLSNGGSLRSASVGSGREGCQRVRGGVRKGCGMSEGWVKGECDEWSGVKEGWGERDGEG